MRTSDERRLEVRKTKAVRKVDRATARAVARLNKNGRHGWKTQGVLRVVCRYSGPHATSVWCWLHRRRVNTVMIPDMEQEGYWATRYFYLGADGRRYRDGVDKIYMAEFHKRRRPRDIKSVARKLDLICPEQD